MKKFKWNKWAIIIAAMTCAYVIFGGVAIGVYARDGRPGEKEAKEATLQAEAPTEEEDHVMTDEEYREFMKMYGSAANETETETEAKEAAKSSEQDLSGYQSVLDKADQTLKEIEEAESEREKATEDTEDSEKETEVSSEQDEEETDLIEGKVGDEEKEKEEDTRTYYTYKVTGIGSSLTLHGTKTQKNDSIDEIPEGYHGYVIEMPATGDKRTLIIYKGKVGYASNMYLTISDIPASEYPEELKTVTAEDAGQDITDGKEAGPLEGQ